MGQIKQYVRSAEPECEFIVCCVFLEFTCVCGISHEVNK